MSCNNSLPDTLHNLYGPDEELNPTMPELISRQIQFPSELSVNDWAGTSVHNCRQCQTETTSNRREAERNHRINKENFGSTGRRFK